MKRCFSFLLVIAVLLSGCHTAIISESTPEDQTQQDNVNTVPNEAQEPETSDANPGQNEGIGPGTEQENEYQPEVPEFRGLEDPNLHRYAQDLIYTELVKTLNDDGYFVENVSAVYVSQEYLDELDFNSRSNIFFGYTLEDLDEQFQGTRYVFTLGENGETGVQFFEEHDDTIDYRKIIKNVAIGTGVILICVTVSVVGGSAVSLIFTTAAKTGTVFALSSGAIGGLSAGIIKGIESGNFDEALKAGTLAASEGFKWGAITGAISGGARKAIALKGATLNGLSMNEAATIQMKEKWPLDVIKYIHSIDEYNIYKNSSLYVKKIAGRTVLTQDIDWDFIGDIADGRTNAQRVLDGLAPLDPLGLSYEIHHIGQMNDSPFAILTSAEHKKFYSVLHTNTGKMSSDINRADFQKIKKQIWNTLYQMSLQGG